MKTFSQTLIAIFIFTILSIDLNAQSYTPVKGDKKFKVQSAVNLEAYSFNLRDVKVTAGPFKQAMDLNALYLLEIEPDRLLHRFRLFAGLKPKGDIYGGWEMETISGHTLGHYLSACAMMYAATGDKRFLDRVNYIVDELELCQRSRKTGYVGGIPNEDTIFAQVKRGDIRTRGFDLNGGWVPWYTAHKVMGGLIDAYLYADNPKAMSVVIKFCDWTEETLRGLNDEKIQLMLACEHGGMNEMLINVYAITATKKYLDLSYKFHHKAILDSLARRKDILPGKHSNTQIPKIIGSARRYELTANASDKSTADFFWNTMVKNHTYAMGGNSDSEHLGQPGKLNDRLSDNTAETCNTYNMLKLTRHLFCWQPSGMNADYYERALYNHILGSQNPADGMMCYFTPLRRGGKKDYSDKFNSFWCCVGSGIENHVKYGESIYYQGADGSLYVNLFIPSDLEWKEKGVLIKQETDFPKSNSTLLTLTSKKSVKMAVRIRNPWWSKDQVKFELNGKEVEAKKADNGYWVIDRTWKNGDQIKAVFVLSTYSESMPDNANRIALLYGPLVLAGELGQEEPDPIYGVPVLLTDNRKVSDWTTATEGKSLHFTTHGVGEPKDISLLPLYEMTEQRYNVYWDYFTPDGWVKQKAEYEAEKLRQKKIAEQTVDQMRIGEMQAEREHNVLSEKSFAGESNARTWRDAREGGFFSFEIKVDDTKENILYCTYWGSDGGNLNFDILVNGTKIATQEIHQNWPNRFFDLEYPIPAELVKGNPKVTIKFQPHPEKRVARLFGARMIRK